MHLLCGQRSISRVRAVQDEALRPFVAVLRHAENALVREMTVQVMSQAITTNPKGLGSGELHHQHRVCKESHNCTQDGLRK